MDCDLMKDFEKYLFCEKNINYLEEFGNISFMIPILLYKINFADFDFNNIFNECFGSSKNNLKIQNITNRNNLNLKAFYNMGNTISENIFMFVLSELSDNIFDHSKCSNAFILGNNFNNDYLDIIIFDDGLSIPHSLELHNHDFNNDCEAILSAINGNSTKETISNVERGCGLNNSFSIMSEGKNNSIIVASRNGLICSKRGKIYKRDISDNLIDGTIAGLRFDLNYSFDSLYNIIRKRFDVKKNMQGSEIDN